MTPTQNPSDDSDFFDFSTEKKSFMQTSYEFARPNHLEKVLHESPIVFLPVGCVEYHGPHLPLGVDMLTAEAFCHRTAHETGGLVLPPFWLASGVLPLPHGVVIDLELLRQNIRSILTQLAKGGFKVIVIFSGHGALDHLHVLREESDRINQDYKGVRAFTTVWNELNFDLAGDIHDHGAKVETSYMMEFFPDSVDLMSLEDDPEAFHVGVYGSNPRFTASSEWGSTMAGNAIKRLVDEVRTLEQGGKADSWKLLKGLVERLQSGDLEIVGGTRIHSGDHDERIVLRFYNPHSQSKYITGIKKMQINGGDIDLSSGFLKNSSMGEGHTDTEIKKLGPLSGFYVRREQEMLLELSDLRLESGSHSVDVEFDLADVVSIKAEGHFIIE